ncbi:conjugal transfer protein TraB [Haematococcus lacustris]|uniref:Conjugal transfer protein TraB n=1 Tax=Haematococcus lacustris TaxID=44745 RepID=A0A699ZRL6_HAELA|nr:conjugal transfer protein TraB [Haematococcus lacustris]
MGLSSMESAEHDTGLTVEFLLGTAHVSRKTAEAVYDTILKVEPDAVVVELCR